MRRISLSVALTVLFLGILFAGLYASAHRAGNDATPAAAMSAESHDNRSVSALTFEELVPSFEKLLVRKSVSDTPSGYAAYVCKSVRDLEGPREVIAYLALESSYEARQTAGQGSLFDPYVGDETFPKGVFNRPEVREALAPYFEEAKQEYLELTSSG